MTKKTKESHIQKIVRFRQQSIIWFGVAVLLMIVLTITSYYSVGKVNDAMNAFITDSSTHTQLFHNLDNAIHKRQHLIQQVSREKNRTQFDLIISKHIHLSQKIDEYMSKIQHIPLMGNEKAFANAIQAQFDLSKTLHQAVILEANGTHDSQISRSYTDTLSSHDSLLAVLGSLIFLERTNERVVTENIQDGIGELLILSIVIPAFFAIIVLLVANRVLKFSSCQKSNLRDALQDLDDSYLKLNAAREEVELANRVRMEFIANISHELRTPMTSIKGALGLLNSDVIEHIPEDAKNLCQIADSNADRLMLLITDVLDFSKITAGELELVFDDLNIENILSKIIKPYEQKARNKKIAFSTSFDNTLPKTIYSDVYCISQIVRQLLNNAIKFTREGHIHLDVSYFDSHKFLKISVTDTGVGFSEKAKRQLFEYFVQGDGSSTREYGGTGLGLAISKRLANAIGGSIGAENNSMDCGSTFWFTIPTSAEKQVA